jgi:putative transposase
VASGTVLTQCTPKHRHQEFLAFLRHIEANVPEQLDVHLICANHGTHKHARANAWLARRPHFHLRFTPTYSFWLNQVERRFALITTQAIRGGSFDSVAYLKRKIEEVM